MVTKEENEYTIDCQLFLKNVTVEDAGKYKVTARNDLGESNATISLNFDSKCICWANKSISMSHFYICLSVTGTTCLTKHFNISR